MALTGFFTEGLGHTSLFPLLTGLYGASAGTTTTFIQPGIGTADIDGFLGAGSAQVSMLSGGSAQVSSVLPVGTAGR